MKLDLLDKKILHQLDINSRKSANEISKKVKASKETVNYRIKRLVDRNYIINFYSLINMSLLGYYTYKIYLKLHRTTAKVEKDLAIFLRKQKRCTNLRLVEGPFDLDFVYIAKNPGDLVVFFKKLKTIFSDYIIEKAVHITTITYKIHQFGPTEEPRLSFDQYNPKEEKIDEIDHKILRSISKRSRIKFTRLGTKIGINAKKVAYRVKRLENKGIIVGYTYKPNIGKFNLDSYQFNIALRNLDYIPSVIRFFEKKGVLRYVSSLLGKYDLSVELHIDGSNELRKIIDDFKENFIDKYVYYDIFSIFKDYVISWYPVAEIKK